MLEATKQVPGPEPEVVLEGVPRLLKNTVPFDLRSQIHGSSPEAIRIPNVTSTKEGDQVSTSDMNQRHQVVRVQNEGQLSDVFLSTIRQH